MEHVENVATVETDPNVMCHSESESSSIQNMNYSGPRVPVDLHLKPETGIQIRNAEENIVLILDMPYIKSCVGLLRLVQVVSRIYTFILLAHLWRGISVKNR